MCMVVVEGVVVPARALDQLCQVRERVVADADCTQLARVVEVFEGVPALHPVGGVLGIGELEPCGAMKHRVRLKKKNSVVLGWIRSHCAQCAVSSCGLTLASG